MTPEACARIPPKYETPPRHGGNGTRANFRKLTKMRRYLRVRAILAVQRLKMKPKMPAESTAATRIKPEARSRISNGSATFLPGTDGRSALARRWRDVASQLTADIGGDPSEAQSLIARRAATLGVWCEQCEAELAQGGTLDIVAFTTATNALRRLLADLGLERRARDVTPNLSDYLATKRTADVEAAT